MGIFSTVRKAVWLESQTLVYTFALCDATLAMRVQGFDWDGGNRAKCQKHGVSIAEIEALFANNPRVDFADERDDFTIAAIFDFELIEALVGASEA